MTQHILFQDEDLLLAPSRSVDIGGTYPATLRQPHNRSHKSALLKSFSTSGEKQYQLKMSETYHNSPD